MKTLPSTTNPECRSSVIAQKRQECRKARPDRRKRRWIDGTVKIPVSPRELERILEAVQGDEMVPQGCSAHELKFFRSRVRGLIRSLFKLATEPEQPCINRIRIPQAERQRLRKAWVPDNWCLLNNLPPDLRKIVVDRVRDWFRRVVVIQDAELFQASIETPGPSAIATQSPHYEC